MVLCAAWIFEIPPSSRSRKVNSGDSHLLLLSLELVSPADVLQLGTALEDNDNDSEKQQHH
jgi:hypothetical protein